MLGEVSYLAAAGLTGQACFFSRFFVQWLASERARRPVVPRSFWWLSLLGATLVGAYALRRGELLFLPGLAMSAWIAAQNLRLSQRRAGAAAGRASLLFLLAALLAVTWIECSTQLTAEEPLRWLLIAAIGQVLWSVRFPVQWWLSERAGVSHFPPVFWWLSLLGNTLILAYALHLGDPVFVLGSLPGPLLQVRNLMLGRRAAPTT